MELLNKFSNAFWNEDVRLDFLKSSHFYGEIYEKC
jgi:hypothetical protein